MLPPVLRESWPVISGRRVSLIAFSPDYRHHHPLPWHRLVSWELLTLPANTGLSLVNSSWSWPVIGWRPLLAIIALTHSQPSHSINKHEKEIDTFKWFFWNGKEQSERILNEKSAFDFHSYFNIWLQKVVLDIVEHQRLTNDETKLVKYLAHI